MNGLCAGDIRYYHATEGGRTGITLIAERDTCVAPS